MVARSELERMGERLAHSSRDTHGVVRLATEQAAAALLILASVMEAHERHETPPNPEGDCEGGRL